MLAGGVLVLMCAGGVLAVMGDWLVWVLAGGCWIGAGVGCGEQVLAKCRLVGAGCWLGVAASAGCRIVALARLK